MPPSPWGRAGCYPFWSTRQRWAHAVLAPAVPPAAHNDPEPEHLGETGRLRDREPRDRSRPADRGGHGRHPRLGGPAGPGHWLWQWVSPAAIRADLVHRGGSRTARTAGRSRAATGA